MFFTVPVNGYHRCHCVYRDSVLFVGRQPDSAGPLCCGSVYVAMSCVAGFFLMVLTILSGTVCCR